MKLCHIPEVIGNPVPVSTVVSLHCQLDAAITAVAAKPSLTEMVLVLLPILRALGLALLRAIIEQRDHRLGSDPAPPCCPRCKTQLTRSRNLRPTSSYTLLGKLSFQRRAFNCGQCGSALYPTDWALRLRDRCNNHSDEFASMVALLTTLLPNAKAMAVFQRCFGFEVSTQLARTISTQIGRELQCQQTDRAEFLWRQRTENPELLEPVPAVLRTIERKKRVYVMVDDSKIGIQDGPRGRGATARAAESPQEKALRKAMQQERRQIAQSAKRTKPGPDAPPKPGASETTHDDNGFRNVRALLIFDEADLADVSKGRHTILKKRVLAHIGTLDEWYKFVHMALAEAGALTAHEVIVIADGGNGIWEMFDELLPTTASRNVVQVLDFYHASSHLWAAARAYKGNSTAKQRQACIAWVKPMQKDLREGRVANVIQRLGKIKATGAVADEISKAKKYFETHRKRMRYNWLRDRKALIGSGAMESVHAWVIQARCRLPGMRWSVDGANTMLRLRCAWASDTWDESFRQAVDAPPRPLANGLKLQT